MRFKYLLIFVLSLFISDATAQIVKKTESSTFTLEKMDAELGKLKNDRQTNTQWINALQFGISDVGWDTGIDHYTRLPEKYKSTVTSNVWRLSRCSAGLAIRFSMKGSSFIITVR